MQGYLISSDRSVFDSEFKQRRIIEVFQKEEAANYRQRSYDLISYVWYRPTNSKCRPIFRLNRISESAELDIFRSKWAYLNFFLKILMAKCGDEVRSETWITGLLKYNITRKVLF